MLVEEFDVFLFDLDGVIYIGNHLLPGVKETMAQLRRLNKQIYFLTNNPTLTRQQFVTRLQGLGIDATINEIVSSGWVTAQTLKLMKITTAYVLGSDGLKTELVQAGIDITPRGDCPAVVVGHDDQLYYRQISRTIQLIYRGAKFFATDADAAFPGPQGPCPGTGAIVSAIETSSLQRPIVIGKPYPPMFRTVLGQLDPSLRVVMVGDNPATDILGAHQEGITAILRSDKPIYFPSPGDFRNPDAHITSIKQLFDPTITVPSWDKPCYAWPETVKPAVAAVIFDEHKKLLLVKRADLARWGLPIGHIEPGETVQQALVREVKEETGLQVTVERYIGVYSDPHSLVVSHPSGKVNHYITSCIACKIVGGHLEADGIENLAVAFFPLDDLPANLLTLHDEWLADILGSNNAGVIR